MRKRIIVGMLLGFAALVALGATVFHVVTRETPGQSFDSAGVRINYYVEGQGEPLILIHGYGANVKVNWQAPKIMQALAKDYQVIAYDCRGHGLSDKPHTPDAYGKELVNDVIRLMDHLNIQKAHVAGYSMGGFTALKLAAMYPERLRSVAVCAAGWEDPKGEKANTLISIVDSLGKTHSFKPLFQALVPEGQKPPLWQDLFLDWAIQHFNDVDALLALMKNFPELAVTEAELKANTVPVCGIVGENDGLRPGAERLLGVMPHYEMVLVKGGDHMNTPGNPAFRQALSEFFSKHREGSTVDKTI